MKSCPPPREAFEQLASWGEERGWAGADPYEGLNAPVARLAAGKRGRQALVQLYKRIPFPPPWPLSAPVRPNAKVLGLILSAYAAPAGSLLAGREAAAGRLLRGIAELRLSSGAGWGWGYHFEVQTRHLLYGSSDPNAVATAFVVGGLLDHHERGGEGDALELALGAGPFLTSLLHSPAGGGAYFGYVPERSRLIHNANLLACAALARLHRHSPDDAVAETVREAVATTLGAQDPAGLWPYGADSNLGWSDNFHTAYVLEALIETERAFGIGAEALPRGLEAWRRRFFGPRGEAKLYPDSPYPLEAHSFASAIDLCCAAGELDPTLLDLAHQVAERAIELLWLAGERRFAYRVTRLGTNRREFMRWTNAPMFRALARLLSEPAAERAA